MVLIDINPILFLPQVLMTTSSSIVTHIHTIIFGKFSIFAFIILRNPRHILSDTILILLQFVCQPWVTAV